MMSITNSTDLAVLMFLDKKGEAFGKEIVDAISQLWAYGPIYIRLSRLQDEGWVTQREEEITRPGLPRFLFSLTDAGRREVQRQRQWIEPDRDLAAEGVPDPIKWKPWRIRTGSDGLVIETDGGTLVCEVAQGSSDVAMHIIAAVNGYDSSKART